MGLNFELDRVEEYGWMNLEEGEEIEFRTHPSIIPKLPELVGGILLSIAALAILVMAWTGIGPMSETLVSIQEENPMIMTLGLFAIFFLGVGDAVWTYFQVKATFYIFTTDKFIRKTNIFRTTTRETPYNKVQHFDMNYRTIVERLLNIGRIGIATAGTGGTELILENVPNPKLATEVLADYT